MANELQEFLKLLGNIVIWIFEWTLNLICFCLLLASLCAIWRTYWIVKCVISDSSSMRDFRSLSAIQFGLVIVDILLIPFAIISILCPTRTYHVAKNILAEWHHSSGTRELYWNTPVRAILFINGWIGIFGDLFCLLFGVISIIIPTRSIAFFRVIYTNWDSYLRDRYCELRLALLLNFALALFDIIAIPHCILALFLPTRTYLFVTQLSDIYNSSPHLRNETVIKFQGLEYNFAYRFVGIKNFYLGLLDFVVLIIVALLSFIFVVRIPELIKLYFKYSTEYKEDKYDKLRIAVCINLLLSIVDLVCFIAAIVVFCTCIRTYPLIKAIQSYYADAVEKRDVILTQYKLDYNIKLRIRIIKHFSFLLIDILFVPLLIICFLSGYQGVDIYHLMKDAKQFDEDRMNLIRKRVLFNFCVLLFDILFMLPLTVIIVVTVYRLPPLYKHCRFSWEVYYFNRNRGILPDVKLHSTLKNYGSCEEEKTLIPKNDENGEKKAPENCRIHICMNALIILCDVLFLLLAVIIICITLYRIPYLWNILTADTDIDTADDYMEEYRAIYRQRKDIMVTACFVFIDIPCAVLCFIVFVTIWRAFKMYNIITNDTSTLTASEFRKHSFLQFIYLIRDILFLIPFAIIAVTLFRLPLLILTILSKLRIPRTSVHDTINIAVEEASLEFQEKGKPRIWINKGSKTLHFALDNDAAKKSCLRLFVLGDAFWNDVEHVFGAAIATAGRSMLPNKLRHGINLKSGLNHGTSNGLNYDLVDDLATNLSDVPFMIQAFIGKRTTILSNLGKFPDPERQFIFQLEHDTKGILWIIAVSIQDLMDCAMSEDGIHPLQKNKNFGLRLDEINQIRGTEHKGIVDMFWVIVAMEFVKWLIDIAHLILFCVLLIIPWRLVQCLYYLLSHETFWNLKRESYVIGIVEYSYFIYTKLYDLLFEPMLNDMVKLRYSQKQVNNAHNNSEYRKWCDKINQHWNEYQNELQIEHNIEAGIDDDINMKYLNFVSLGPNCYDFVVRTALRILRRDIKPKPPNQQLVTELFEIQNIRLYLKVMQSKSNMLTLQNQLKWEHQAIFSEQLHCQQRTMKQQMIHLYHTIHESHDEAAAQSKQFRNVKCAIFSKNLSTSQRIIRFFVYKAIVDVMIMILFGGIAFLMALPFLFDGVIYEGRDITVLYTVLYYIAVLLLTIYIIPFLNIYNLLKFKYYVRRSHLRFGFKQIMLAHFQDILQDLLALLGLLMCTLLILLTLVRIFEFISALVDGGKKRGKKQMTLNLAYEIAKAEVSKIWRDLYQLFNLFFMWKTYKFAVTSLVFGILLPAAGFIEIFAVVCSKCPQKVRQIVAMALWFGFLIIILVTITAFEVDIRSLYILCFVSLSICIAFFIALFGFIKIDEHDLISQRQTRAKVENVAYNQYYTVKVCNICHNQCRTLDATPTNNEHGDFCGNECRICGRYLWEKDRSYHCLSCHYCCISCGQVTLQSFKSNDKKVNYKNVAQILWSYGNDEYISYWMRITWLNILALLGLLLDVLLMISVLLYAFYIQHAFNIFADAAFDTLYSSDTALQSFVEMATSMLLHFDSITKEQFLSISIITLIFGGLWVIVVSLPLVCENLFHWTQKKGTFVQNSLWIKITWLYKTFFVVLLVYLIKLFQCIYVENECIVISSHSSTYSYAYAGISQTAFVFLIFFWFTSSICNTYNSAQICWTANDNLDIRYPLAFTHGLEILQSLFIVCAMLLVLNNTQIAFLICMIISWLMLAWHVLYGWLIQCVIKDYNANTIYNFTSITYFTALQIGMYAVVTYIATLLYLYLYVLNVDNLMSLGDMIKYGIIIIIVLSLVMTMLLRYYLYRNRIKQLHQRKELNVVINSLTALYEETSQYGSMDSWYDEIGRSKLVSFRNNIWSSTSDLVALLIEFERHLLYSRLSKHFLEKRDKWIAAVMSLDNGMNNNFDSFIPLVDELKDSICSPPFFSILLKALSEDCDLFSRAPLDVCFVVMEFIVPSAEIRFIAQNTLLHPNQFPVFGQNKKGIIKQMAAFGAGCDAKLHQFIQDISYNN